MKAIVHTAPRSLEVRDVDRPSPGPGEALVEVHTAGVCGSDAHAYLYDDSYEWIKLPRIVGHEYSGRVVEVGEGVDAVAPGDPVVEEPIHDCGTCFQCKNGQPNVCQNVSITGMHTDGAYADYAVVDAEHLHAVPEGVPLGQAAITEPLSVAARAVLTQSEAGPGDEVLVEGPGPIGVLTAAVADSIGANVVVSGLGKDTAYRLPLVEDLGIDTVDVETTALETVVEERTDGLGFDVVLDATGHSSGVETAVDVVRKGGQVVVVGIPGSPSEVSMPPVVRGEIAIETSYGSTWRNFEQALGLLADGSVDADAIVDRSYGIDDPAAAFEAFLDSETCKPVFSFADR